MVQDEPTNVQGLSVGYILLFEALIFSKYNILALIG